MLNEAAVFGKAHHAFVKWVSDLVIETRGSADAAGRIVWKRRLGSTLHQGMDGLIFEKSMLGPATYLRIRDNCTGKLIKHIPFRLVPDDFFDSLC